MRSLVVGASGLVGQALLRRLGDDAVGTYRSRPLPGLVPLDARDADALRARVREARARVVFFPAADPNVDWCETHADEAREANVVPALRSVAIAADEGARLVYFSSDYVFDGTAGPYDEDVAPRPLSVYGRHKLEVERSVLAAGGTVVRTTTVYGREPGEGKNFVLRLVARLRAGERARVPYDQVSTPTWSDELAEGSVAVAERGGVWNVAGPDLLARDAFARLVASAFGLDASLIDAVPTSALVQPARRPLAGGLRTERLARVLGRKLLPTREALVRLRAQL